MTTKTESCFPESPGGPRLSSGEEARAAILAVAQPVAETRDLPCDEALGRVLAEDIDSSIDVPPHDNSAMDGYALRLADLDEDLCLPVRQRIAAGQPAITLEPGAAARIFTGAPIPAGADAVVIQEDCAKEGDRVRLLARPKRGANIRPRGNDIQAGGRVLSAGVRLEARHLGMLAAVGA